MNFVRGNNNESTSEAANAYGAIVLYGLITGKEELVERGMYLHASTATTYWVPRQEEEDPARYFRQF